MKIVINFTTKDKTDKKEEIKDLVSSYLYYDKLKVVKTSNGIMVVISCDNRVDVDSEPLKEMVNDIERIIEDSEVIGTDVKIYYGDQIIYHEVW